MEERRYKIGEKVYYQTKLGLLRSSLAMKVLTQSLESGTGIGDLTAGLVAYASRLMPIVLLDEGMTEAAWVEAYETAGWFARRKLDFQCEGEYAQALEVVEDFLAYNPVVSWLERAGGVTKALQANLLTHYESLNASVPSSREEIPLTDITS